MFRRVENKKSGLHQGTKMPGIKNVKDAGFYKKIINMQMLRSVCVIILLSYSYVAYGQIERPLFTERHEETFLEETFILGYMKSNMAFYILTKTEYYELKLVSERNWVKNYYLRNDMFNETEVKDLTWVTNDSLTYLVAEGSGYMYEFTGNSIIRLQNSYDQRVNSASTYFIYGSSIFNFSGYGFWQYPSFISKYDLITDKASAFLPQGGVLVPPSQIRPLSLFNEESRSLYVWGGSKVAYSNSVTSQINNTNELWRLDLESRSWENLGKVNMPGAFSDNKNTSTFIAFKSDKELFSILGDRLYVFDVLNNNISTYKISEGFDLNVDADIQPAYSNSAKALLVSTAPFPNQNVRRVQFVSLSNYKSEFVSETKLIKTHFKTYLIIGVIIIFVLAFVYLVYYLYKNYYIYYNKLIVIRSTKSIKFNNKLIKVLDTEESELLFWIAQSDGFVTTNYIMDRPSDGSQNYESLKKRKLNTMKSIEVKLGALSQVKKNVFIERKSSEDLRLKEYKLNADWIVLRD